MVQLTVNGVVYNYPELTDEGWGPDATNWALAITQGTLTKAGGLFTLTSDVDFGPNFGIKSIYYKSRSSNISTAGQVRLSNSDTISFRNSGNSGNLSFGPGSSDAIPQWNGIDLVNLSTAQTLSNKTLVSPIITGSATFVDLTTTGNTVIGDASSDTLAINADIITNLIPQAADTYDIGTSTLRWRDIYLNRAISQSGSASLPSYTFNSDTDTGMYRELSNKIAFSTGGFRRMAIADSSIFLDIPTYSLDGSAVDPSYAFDNGHSTGMYLVSPGVLGFTGGGQFALKLNSTAVSPQLAIQNIDGISSIPSYSFANSQSAGMYLETTNKLAFSTNSVRRIAIADTSIFLDVPTYSINGTATDPSYAFDNDHSTGMYRSGSGTLGFSAGGQFALKLTSTAVMPQLAIQNIDGTASTPSYSFANAQTTGLYLSAPNTLGFSTNGTQVANFSSAGAFTVGSTPTSTTHTFYGKVSHQGSNNSGIDWEFWNFDVGPTSTSTIDLRAYGDPQVRFVNSNDSSSFTIGKDVTDNAFKIAATGSLGGANNFLAITIGGAFDIGEVGGSSNHNINGTSTSFTNSGGSFVKNYHIQSATLLDNTASAVVFTYTASGSENIIVEYSLTRSPGTKETGTMIITQDGSTAQVVTNSLNIGTTGVTFSADLNAGNVRLLYTTTSTGFNASMKYSTKVWAD